MSNLNFAVPFRALAACVVILGSVGACAPDSQKTPTTSMSTSDSAPALVSEGAMPEFAVMEPPVRPSSRDSTLCPSYVRQQVTGRAFLRAGYHEVRQAKAPGEPLVITVSRAAYIPSSPSSDGRIPDDTVHLDCRTLERLRGEPDVR